MIVDAVTRLGVLRSGVRIPEKTKHFFHIIPTVSGSNPCGGEIFRICPDRPWDPSSLLYNGYRFFPWGKAAGPWRWPPFPSSAHVKESVVLYLYSPSRPSWPVLGWTLPLTLPLPDRIWEQATLISGYRSSLTGKRRHLHLVPRLSMSGAVPPHPPPICFNAVDRKNVTLTLPWGWTLQNVTFCLVGKTVICDWKIKFL